MSDAPKTMPARIWAEQESYDFSGYSPCWVWHGEQPEECQFTTEYVRADLAITLPADDAEMVERVARALCAEWSKAVGLPTCGGKGTCPRCLGDARAVLSAMKGEP